MNYSLAFISNATGSSYKNRSLNLEHFPERRPDHIPGPVDTLPGVDNKFRSICDRYEGLIKDGRHGYPPDDYGKHVKFQGKLK